MTSSRAIHEFLTRDSRVVLPRVGGGVGGRGEGPLMHASYLTEWPVDNFAAATVDRISRAACKSIDRRWFR